jgi:hypothetical protein
MGDAVVVDDSGTQEFGTQACQSFQSGKFPALDNS